MSNYYNNIKLSLSTNLVDYIPACLIDMILSYAIYPSINFDTWINDSKNEKYKTMLNICQGKKTSYGQIDDNYNKREYFFTKHKQMRSVFVNFNLANVEQIFDVWEIEHFCALVVGLKDNFMSKHDYDLSSGKVQRSILNEEYSGEKTSHNYSLIVISNLSHISNKTDYTTVFISESSTLERLYIYPFNQYTKYSKIKIFDNGNLGFLSFSKEMRDHCLKLIKWNDYDIEDTRDLEIDQLYYFNNSKSVYHFIFSLKDGRWASSNLFTPSIINIYSCLTAAVSNCCTVDKFVELQTDMLLNNSVCPC